MAPTPEELEQVDFKQRTRDQVQMIRDAFGGDVASDLPDDADHKYLFVPGRVLVASAEVGRLNSLVNDNLGLFETAGSEVGNPIPGLSTFEFPAFREPDRDPAVFLRNLNFLDATLGSRVVTPDHYLHVAAIGGGRPCPATEPQETGVSTPWPTEVGGTTAGSGVRVSIIDTGGPPPSDPAVAPDTTVVETLTDPLNEYAGHGTFIEGVVRGRAPGAQIEHLKFLVQGGAIQESEMIARLRTALMDSGDGPHVINLSAGGHTRNGFELASLQQLWTDTLQHLTNTILVAAAGNDGTDDPFYPAAFDWAVGVGSLDRDDTVSSFSNYGRSAHIFVVGRNHINAYPQGTYVCKEAPDKGDVRFFDNGMARWSGTSFAAPLVAGMIAARASSDGQGVIQAANAIQAEALDGTDTTHGPFRYISSNNF